jgi:multicomponent Na+:H+ antiporter subunit D
MSSHWIHPSLVLLLGCGILPLVPARLKRTFLLLVPAVAFGVVLTMARGEFWHVQFLKWTLTFGRVDSLSLVFAHIMTLMCLIGTLYGAHVEEDGQHIAAWIYVAGSLGAIFAGDLFTLFLFWEVMAFSSVFLIWFRRRPESTAAGFRYLLVHVAGGLSLLAGIVLHVRATGSTAFTAFDVHQTTVAGYLILIGFILNAAVPPLHAWLPDAYPEGTFNGSVFLSAFTTKTAVYALCRGFAGMELLVILGVIMSLYGVVYAIIENDARRLFAYHIVSQVGYMVTGVGLGDPSTPLGQLALNGACAHAFAHILYKGQLFMGSGAVLYMTGETRMSELGGLYKKMPWTFLFTLIGGLSISAFPLFSGFVSKSMIVQAGFDQHVLWAAFLLNLASIGTFYCNGLKIPYFIWFGKNHCRPETWQRAADPPWNMRAAMGLTAFLCIFIGCYTPYLYNLLPYAEAAHAYHPYTSYHVSETLQILLFTALGFFVLVKWRKIEPHRSLNIDLDWFYRLGGRAFFWLARRPVQFLDTCVGEVYRVGGLIPLMKSAHFVGIFDNRVIDGAVDGLAAAVRGLGSRLRGAQRGAVQENLTFVFAIAAGLLLAFLIFL